MEISDFLQHRHFDVFFFERTDRSDKTITILKQIFFKTVFPTFIIKK